jgi:hypothetical protein
MNLKDKPSSNNDEATSRRRDRYLSRTYGIDATEYGWLLDTQGGGCYGCGRSGVTRNLHVDHDHKTGVVRGILCISCNSALQKLKDDASIARNLARYLEAPPAVALLGERLYSGPAPRRKRKRKR